MRGWRYNRSRDLDLCFTASSRSRISSLRWMSPMPMAAKWAATLASASRRFTRRDRWPAHTEQHALQHGQVAHQRHLLERRLNADLMAGARAGEMGGRAEQAE